MVKIIISIIIICINIVNAIIHDKKCFDQLLNIGNNFELNISHIGKLNDIHISKISFDEKIFISKIDINIDKYNISLKDISLSFISINNFGFDIKKIILFDYIYNNLNIKYQISDSQYKISFYVDNYGSNNDISRGELKYDTHSKYNLELYNVDLKILNNILYSNVLFEQFNKYVSIPNNKIKYLKGDYQTFNNDKDFILNLDIVNSLYSNSLDIYDFEDVAIIFKIKKASKDPYLTIDSYYTKQDQILFSLNSKCNFDNEKITFINHVQCEMQEIINIISNNNNNYFLKDVFQSTFIIVIDHNGEFKFDGITNISNINIYDTYNIPYGNIQFNLNLNKENYFSIVGETKINKNINSFDIKISNKDDLNIYGMISLSSEILNRLCFLLDRQIIKFSGENIFLEFNFIQTDIKKQLLLRSEIKSEYTIPLLFENKQSKESKFLYSLIDIEDNFLINGILLISDIYQDNLDHIEQLLNTDEDIIFIKMQPKISTGSSIDSLIRNQNVLGSVKVDFSIPQFFNWKINIKRLDLDEGNIVTYLKHIPELFDANIKNIIIDTDIDILRFKDNLIWRDIDIYLNTKTNILNIIGNFQKGDFEIQNKKDLNHIVFKTNNLGVLMTGGIGVDLFRGGVVNGRMDLSDLNLIDFNMDISQIAVKNKSVLNKLLMIPFSSLGYIAQYIRNLVVERFYYKNNTNDYTLFDFINIDAYINNQIIYFNKFDAQNQLFTILFKSNSYIDLEKQILFIDGDIIPILHGINNILKKITTFNFSTRYTEKIYWNKNNTKII